LNTLPQFVAGIDVGGPKKGFHGVALRNGQHWTKFATRDAVSMAGWCRDQVGASAIGVDAPCRWSATGGARPAERALAKAGIHCFATPSFEAAQSNPFYAWMKSGIEVFGCIERDYPLFDGASPGSGKAVCFETFPQAVACALAGKPVSPKQKATIRRELLRKAGIAVADLTNIDMVDAALCAVAAHYYLENRAKKYGDPATGFIVVPEMSAG
jgi:predicted nuclease with RNAse H fold